MDQSLLDKLADRYRLRKLPKSTHWVGVHRGVGMDVALEDAEVSFLFFTPSANVGDEILEHFKGFTRWAETGLPCEWIRGRVEDDSSCVLTLGGRNVSQMGEEQFLAIPDVIASDMQAHGATEAFPCQNCCQEPVSQVGLIDYRYTLLCRDCWQAIQAQASGGEIQTVQVVSWRLALVALTGVVVIGAVGWGLIQELEVHLGRSLGLALFFLAFLWGGLVCDYVPRWSEGVNFALRLSVALSVLMGLFLGNVWGYYALLRQQMPRITFHNAINLYFHVQLGEHFGNELPYLAGGFLGAWVGFSVLKGFGVTKVR